MTIFIADFPLASLIIGIVPAVFFARKFSTFWVVWVCSALVAFFTLLSVAVLT